LLNGVLRKTPLCALRMDLEERGKPMESISA
jgi:hypothetical protein